MAGVCVASSFIFATLKTPKEISDLVNKDIAISYISLKNLEFKKLQGIQANSSELESSIKDLPAGSQILSPRELIV